MAAGRADTVGAIPDPSERRSNATGFLLGHFVQAFQDFVVLQLGGPLRPIAIVRFSQIGFNLPDAIQQSGQLLLELRSYRIVLGHVGAPNQPARTIRAR